ncbi:MAG TPA: response regulator, partial [Polyangia bacterium]
LGEAIGRLQHFLERKVRRLLVVEDDDVQRKAIVELIGNGDVITTPVPSGEEALKTLDTEPFDCVVLDLRLPGMSGFDLIQAIKERPSWRRIPIIVYTGKELTRDEETKLRQLAETIIVKDVRSPERLLDETALFLHRVEARLPQPKREMLRRIAESDPALAGKKVLLVDDDARNLFALTTVLEQHAMKVIYAENGQQALEKLASEPGINIVLMDIMMPEMDGYEATRRIRAQTRYANLPVIALTAKAMKGDRDKCIQAGASDYITKPVDPDQLVSLLRVWLYR